MNCPAAFVIPGRIGEEVPSCAHRCRLGARHDMEHRCDCGMAWIGGTITGHSNLEFLQKFHARVMAMEPKLGRNGTPAKRNYGRGYNLAIARAKGEIT